MGHIFYLHRRKTIIVIIPKHIIHPLSTGYEDFTDKMEALYVCNTMHVMYIVSIIMLYVQYIGYTSDRTAKRLKSFSYRVVNIPPSYLRVNI